MTRREGRALYVVLAFAVAALLLVDTARGEITAIYPKKVCEKTSLSKIKSGGDPIRNKPVVWGVVSFKWCERRLPGKWQGAVVNYSGPLTQTGITGWGKRNGWVYEGESKWTLKCVNQGPWGCSYVRVKIWHEFDKELLGVSIGHHTMKFSLLVGNGQEYWQ